MEAHEFDLYAARKFLNKKSDATQRGLEFKLTFQAMKNILRAKKCYYTGVPLTKAVSSDTQPSDLTIDRIDSSKGYIPGNCVAACHAFNQLKAKVDSAGLEGMKVAHRAFGKAVKRMSKKEKK